MDTGETERCTRQILEQGIIQNPVPGSKHGIQSSLTGKEKGMETVEGIVEEKQLEVAGNIVRPPHRNFSAHVIKDIQIKNSDSPSDNRTSRAKNINAGKEKIENKGNENDQSKQYIHLIISKMVQNSSSQANLKKRYQCLICNATFKQSWNCVSHMQSHTRVKPLLSCNVCGKKCSKRSELAIHTRIHTGDKPFECPRCSRRFVRLGHLKEHMRCHTGEKPYTCSKCGVTFSCSSNMKRHAKMHDHSTQFSAKTKSRRKTADPENVRTVTPCPPYPIPSPKVKDGNDQHDYVPEGDAKVTPRQEEALHEVDVSVNFTDHTQRQLQVLNQNCTKSKIVLLKEGGPPSAVQNMGVSDVTQSRCEGVQWLKSASSGRNSDARTADMASSNGTADSTYSYDMTCAQVITIQDQAANESDNGVAMVTDGLDAGAQQGQNDSSNLLGLDWSFLLEELNSSSVVTQTSQGMQGVLVARPSSSEAPPVHAVSSITLPVTVSDLRHCDLLRPITISIPHVPVPASQYSLQVQPQESSLASIVAEDGSVDEAGETTIAHSSAPAPAVMPISASLVQPQLGAQTLFLPPSDEYKGPPVSGQDSSVFLKECVAATSDSLHQMVTVPLQQVTVQTQQLTVPTQQVTVPTYQLTVPAHQVTLPLQQLTSPVHQAVMSMQNQAVPQKDKQDKPWQCDVCHLTFSRNWYLTVHRNAHFRQKSFSCGTCGASFLRVGNLNRHLRVHTGEKPFRCDTCDATFGTKYRLAEHTRRHEGIKPFKCEACNGSFTDGSSLRRHLRTHEGENLQHQCEVCGAAFNTSHSLAFHMRAHVQQEEAGSKFSKGITLDEGEATARDMPIVPLEEGISDTPCVLKETSKEGILSFICNVCHKKFRFSAACRQHIMCHTGSRPFVCKECGARFSRKADARRHMKIHLKVTPHRCKECGKTFVTKSKLALHVESHMDQGTCLHKRGQDRVTFSDKTMQDVHQQNHPACSKNWGTSSTNFSVSKKEATSEDSDENGANNAVTSAQICLPGEKETSRVTTFGDGSMKAPRREAARKQQTLMSALIAELRKRVASGDHLRQSIKHRSKKRRAAPLSPGRKLLLNPYVTRCEVCSKTFSTHQRLQAHQCYHHNCRIARQERSKCNADLKSHSDHTSCAHLHNSHLQLQLKTKDISASGSCMSDNKMQLPGKTSSCEKQLQEMQQSLDLGVIAFRCNVCKLETDSKEALTDHLKVHPLCSECGIAFHHACNLSVHARTHTGQKPYVCCTCGLSFAKNSQLTVHQRKHSGQKTLKCRQCDMFFPNLRVLKQHEQMHLNKTASWQSLL